MTETVALYRKRLRRNALRVVLGLYCLVVTPFVFGYFRDPSRGMLDIGAITFGYSFMALAAYGLMSLVSPPVASRPPQEPIDDIGISPE